MTRKQTSRLGLVLDCDPLLSVNYSKKMRYLAPLLLTSYAASQTYARPTGILGSAKALLSQVNSLTGGFGLDAVESAFERVWFGQEEERVLSSFVEASGVRCTSHFRILFYPELAFDLFADLFPLIYRREDPVGVIARSQSSHFAYKVDALRPTRKAAQRLPRRH